MRGFTHFDRSLNFIQGTTTQKENKMNVATVAALILTLTLDKPVLAYIDQHAGYVQSIQREDGSGKSFNITMRTANGLIVTIYKRFAA